jgi:hypothetical protein
MNQTANEMKSLVELGSLGNTRLSRAPASRRSFDTKTRSKLLEELDKLPQLQSQPQRDTSTSPSTCGRLHLVENPRQCDAHSQSRASSQSMRTLSASRARSLLQLLGASILNSVSSSRSNRTSLFLTYLRNNIPCEVDYFFNTEAAVMFRE